MRYQEKLQENQQRTSGIVTINKFDEKFFFMSSTTREQLHQQIDSLPDHIVEQIASLILSITTQQKIGVSEYTGQQSTQWQDFSLTQLFGEDDEIEYSLEDAQEIYLQIQQSFFIFMMKLNYVLCKRSLLFALN